MADPIVLCLNGGSSSIKFSLYDLGAAEKRLANGAVERIGLDGGRAWVEVAGESVERETTASFPDHLTAVRAAFEALAKRDLPAPAAVGHRLVHGGPDHWLPERVDDRLLETLRKLVPFAPLHLPAEIAQIEAVAQRFPGLPQVVCFDTAFHHAMPELAARLPLPRSLWEAGIRRYGFHGLSYEYIVAQAGAAALGRAVIAHLGNGASMAAVRDGEPVDTTMGLTPTGGFMMGTRSGDLDPGVLLHLLTHRGLDATALDHLVNSEAGLLGVSGRSPDMKTLLDERARDPHAAQAVEMFCYQVRKHIGALAAALGGLDTLVFTGGIGERAAPVRRAACRGLEHLGVRLDERQNDAGAGVISAPGASCTVRVMRTDEDLMIARHTRAIVFPLASPPN